jgi:hypothetical protein
MHPSQVGLTPINRRDRLMGRDDDDDHEEEPDE